MDPKIALLGSHAALEAGILVAGLFALGLQIGKAIWTRARVRQYERLTRHQHH